jgi:predicted phage gp36 major capsid-like protein
VLPGALYGPRINSIDMRVSKILTFKRTRTNVGIDLYNLFNANTGTAFNGTAAMPDIYNLQAGLPPRFRKSAGATFMGNILVLNKVRALDTYGGGAFWTNLTSNTPAALLGQPTYEALNLHCVWASWGPGASFASAVKP